MKKLCDRCHQREATCLFRQVVNGKETKQSLCADCAAAVGMPDLWSGFFGMGAGELRRAESDKRCDLCGSSFSEIEKSGKVGCPRCYETFRDELEATIRRIHGDTAYKGEREASQKKEESPLESAKRRLKEAVEREDYEQAALLRDEIRSLAEGGAANA